MMNPTGDGTNVPPPHAGDERYRAKIDLPVSAEEAFAYHERPGCLQRLTPPWESVRVESSDQSLHVGSRVVMKAKVLGMPLRWRARHTEYSPPHGFADTQDAGPFHSWNHFHQFQPINDYQCDLTDDLRYRLPLGWAGRLLGGRLARRAIESLFAYRHRITHDDLALHSRYAVAPMTIAISGTSGLVGSSIASLLTLLGHRVLPITRGDKADSDAIAPWGEPQEARKLRGVDAVIHLAGKSIASGRWSKKLKSEILSSRVEKTRHLAELIASCEDGPRTFLCASATGIYGSCGDALLTEQSPPGDDFLSGVAVEWERACQPAVDAGCRVAHARLGIVLDPNGGALQKMLLPAKLAGGRLGNGRQWWSWIGLDDVVGGLYHLLASDSLSGPFNFVSPNPIQNADFVRVLGKVIGIPALFPAPAPLLRFALGEMADALLLASSRVTPNRLLESGYQFRFPELADQLRYCLGRVRKPSQEDPSDEDGR